MHEMWARGDAPLSKVFGIQASKEMMRGSRRRAKVCQKACRASGAKKCSSPKDPRQTWSECGVQEEDLMPGTGQAGLQKAFAVKPRG